MHSANMKIIKLYSLYCYETNSFYSGYSKDRNYSMAKHNMLQTIIPTSGKIKQNDMLN